MKTYMRKLIPAVVLGCLLAGSAMAQTRVATVDTQKVFDQFWKTKQATAALKERANEMDKTHKQMVSEWKKDKTEYQKLLDEANNQAISSAERQKRQQAAEDKLKEMQDQQSNIKQFDRQAHATLGEQKSRMRKNILDEIKLAISSKAKAEGYSLVIDSGAQTYVADPSGPYYTPMVLYSSGANDLTAAVISQLNAGAPLDSSTNATDNAAKPDQNQN